MAVLALLAILWITPSILCLPKPISKEPTQPIVYNDFPFITREQWDANPPVNVVNMDVPVPFVVIHHTYYPEACFTFDECVAAMKHMQDFHQEDNGWNDIGYSFAVGSDGAVYEGRGWNSVGGHTFGYNTRSIGIALIGDWTSELPPQTQKDATKNLIKEGVRLGYIDATYNLIAHLQVSETACPGEALYKEISTWDGFDLNVNGV